MILITGATGNLGSSVVKYLRNKVVENNIIVSSSNDVGLFKLNALNLQTRIVNFNESQRLNKSLNGVNKLLLISTMDPNRYQQHKNIIDAAKKAGVQHIYYTGLAIKDIHNSAVKDLMMSHFETEEYLKTIGITYTIIRNTMYADALTQILGPNAIKQNIVLPGGSGKVPYLLRDEMGEIIANLLVQEGHQNAVYNITGSQSYSYKEISQIINSMYHHPIEYEDISEDEYIKSLESVGLDRFSIYLYAGTIADIKNHQYEIVDPIAEQLLGRQTMSAEDFIKRLF